MKILIAPMASQSETSGPFGRARELAITLLERGHEVAFCAAEEINYMAVNGVYNYPAPIPSVMGLPKFLGNRMLRIAQITGAQSRRTIHSFEEVLYIVGATAKDFFPQDVECLLKAIDDFLPDVVYAEFRIAAIVAAKMAGVPVVTGYSFPTQKSFACNPEYSAAVRSYLKNHDLPEVESALEIFEWAQMKIVPSSRELEPLSDKNVIFTGPFSGRASVRPAWEGKRKNIVVYMGTGSISPKLARKELGKAFYESAYDVYIASKQMKEEDDANFHCRERYDFGKLLPDAAVFINHGGQNSIMTGLRYGVPQIVCPGRVFERKYNAESISKILAGVVVDMPSFRSENLREQVRELAGSELYYDSAYTAGVHLTALNGSQKAAEAMERMEK